NTKTIRVPKTDTASHILRPVSTITTSTNPAELCTFPCPGLGGCHHRNAAILAEYPLSWSPSPPPPSPTHPWPAAAGCPRPYPQRRPPSTLTPLTPRLERLPPFPFPLLPLLLPLPPSRPPSVTPS
ncbi:unnamed protein product, partial [Ectocarpus sp. 8 AP-2014]